MRCPFCDGEMEKGFLQSGSMMVWVKKKHYWSLYPKGDEILVDKNYLTGCAVPAWICKKCKKIMLEYAEQNESEF